MHDPKVSFSTGGKSFSGSANIIEKGPIAAGVKRLMKEKYEWDEGLIVELVPC